MEDCAQALFSGGPVNGSAALAMRPSTASSRHSRLLMEARSSSVERSESRVSTGIPAIEGHTARVSATGQELADELDKAPRVAGRRYPFTRKGPRSAAEGSAAQRYPPMLPSNRFVEKQAYWGMSRASRGILQSAHAAGIVEARRRNFNYLLRALSGVNGFSPVVPPFLMARVPWRFRFSLKTAPMVGELEKRGILIQGWPGYYPGLAWDAYPDACFLKDNLLTLPVHQGLTLAHMEYIAGSVREIARLGPTERPC